MSQNPRDQINKASWTLVEGIKDAVSSNLLTATTTKRVDIKPEVLERLLAIVNASIDEGFHRGSRTFGKVVDTALSAAALPPLAKKKSG